MKCNGPIYAKISNNSDPEKTGRVKVQFQLLGEIVESEWMDVMQSYAGSLNVPEVGDQVLVAFYGGDTASGVVLGGIWTISQKPPKSGLDMGGEFNADGKNTRRYFKTRGSNAILFDDKSGDQKIQIINSFKINAIDMLAKKKIFSLKSKNRVVIKASKTLKISADKGSVKLNKNLFIKGKGITIKAGKDIKVKAGQVIECKGKNIKLN